MFDRYFQAELPIFVQIYTLTFTDIWNRKVYKHMEIFLIANDFIGLI